MTPPAFMRPARNVACQCCGMAAVGVLLARHRSTGETAELTLCERCRSNPQRTVWRRYETADR